MCHVPGIEPASSCFLCAVQIEGRRTLSPACGMPVAEGMVVITNSDDVRTARKIALELLLSDHAGECVAPCAAVCPAGWTFRDSFMASPPGDTRRAMEVIADKLALPGALGRICPRLCERQCRRTDLDQGLSIGALHRYVAADVEGRIHAAARARSPVNRSPSWARDPRAWPPLTIFCNAATTARCSTRIRFPAACCATESPPSRLPKDALDAEIESHPASWRAFPNERALGQRTSPSAELRARHDAVFLAIGAQRAQSCAAKASNTRSPGIEFLEQVAKASRWNWAMMLW
jgi:formate dehydrogenase major subunit